MQVYVATTRGEQIAQDSGLADLARRIHETDYGDPLLMLLTQDNPFFIDNNEPQDFVDVAIQSAYSGLKKHVERVDFNRGLAIDEELDSWRRVTGRAEGTLFPMSETQPFQKAAPEDPWVVSGLAGLQLTKFRGQCHLLAKSRFEEYGYETFAESCAFAGAYIVGKLIDKDRERLFDKDPSFSYSKDGTTHTVSLGGTFHGDFTMTETKSVEQGIISPANKSVEYGPRYGGTIGGYHSIEPDIVESMVEHTLITEGKQATYQLVNGFIDLISDVVTPDGTIDFRHGNFADYGDSDMKIKLLRLNMMLSDDDHLKALTQQPELLSQPYLPQSKTLFEIVSKPAGLRFQNRNESYMQDVDGIDVDAKHFNELFSCLLAQTRAGLGRTSPHQLVSLVLGIKELLSNVD